MPNVIIDKKDEIAMKLIHYFVTVHDYKPIVVNGIQNEIWLENMENEIKLIRLNINYIHNNEQFKTDMIKAETIRKNIKKKTYSFKMKLLNILIDLGDNVILDDESVDITTIKVTKIGDIKKNKMVNEYFPDLKDKINSKKSNVMEMFKMTDELNQKNERDEKKLSKIFKPGLPIITYALIIINALLFIVMLSPNVYTSFINLFANYYENVQMGEVYRLITSVFLHGNFIHLFFNMYALFLIGPEVEKCYGKLKFLVIFIVSGLFGSLLSCLFTNAVSIGASGAIFGLFGSLLYFGYNFRATLDRYLKGQILPLILLNLIIGFLIPGIDVVSYIGGLIGGVFISIAVGIKGRGVNNRQIHALIMTTILLISLSYMLIIK